MHRDYALILSLFCRQAKLLLASLSLVLAFEPSVFAQSSAGPAQPLITRPISEGNLVAQSGNTRPEAKIPANDRGIVADSMPMPHMLLQLRRPAAQEQALVTLIDQLHDPQSPNFHHWITAAELGAQFGPAASDIQAITGWLQQHGFTVNVVYPSKMVIDFSGTAGQVRTAYHTEIHNIDVKGVARLANMTDPQIPAAMAPLVVGVVSLHNIPPKPMHKNVPRRRNDTIANCQYAGYVEGTDCYAVVPADLATIYNFNPVFNSGNTGQNQTIYLIEDSDLYGGTTAGTNSDWSTFRSTFGLSGYRATINTVHPGNNCTDPQTNQDDGEAILDAEWASAAAPSANIVIAACATNSTFGGLIALQNLINGASPPAIISLSYGECEVSNGAAANAAYNSIYQLGVAGGASIFVSTGDSAADVCDRGDQIAYSGVGVNGFGSTPYNVAVGGTDFSVVSSGTVSTYWNGTNTATYGSAKSYMPEMPWNGSCGSLLIAAYYGFSGSNAAYDFCNSSMYDEGAWQYYPYSAGGGSGGPSGCAAGTSTLPSGLPVVDGTCTGWPKPSWQSGVIGIQNDGVRDLPDVSIFASNAVWNAYYVFCWSDTSEEALGCSGPPSNWNGAGGTSFSSPIWAGIQALINNRAGGRQGLPNYRYYQLAAQEYGSSGNSACNSSNGNGVASTCVFYDVTVDGIVVPCGDFYGYGYAGYFDCYDPGGVIDAGVLSTNNNSYAPAYAATVGWDFATGIGSVNVFNLVTTWVEQPALQVNPTTNIVSTGKQGGPFTPTSFQYQLTASAGSVNYQVTGIPSWLNANFTSGTATTTPTTVTFSLLSAGSLTPGGYFGTITFTNTSNGVGNTSITAELAVSGPLAASPTSGVAPLGVTFQTGLAQGDPNTYTVNFGDGMSSGPMSIRPSGITCVVSGPCTTGIASTSHTYTSSGSYTATLLNSALTGVATVGITVSGASRHPVSHDLPSALVPYLRSRGLSVENR
jgi:subtilase family serine protease